jgi:hypothetical protein
LPDIMKCGSLEGIPQNTGIWEQSAEENIQTKKKRENQQFTYSNG